jgi:hypothetical protein
MLLISAGFTNALLSLCQPVWFLCRGFRLCVSEKNTKIGFASGQIIWSIGVSSLRLKQQGKELQTTKAPSGAFVVIEPHLQIIAD